MPMAWVFIWSSGQPHGHGADPDPLVLVAPPAMTHTSPVRDRYRLASGASVAPVAM